MLPRNGKAAVALASLIFVVFGFASGWFVRAGAQEATVKLLQKQIHAVEKHVGLVEEEHRAVRDLVIRSDEHLHSIDLRLSRIEKDNERLLDRLRKVTSNR